ncbi:MAG TPA: ABC transporter permease [bacterium]|nr:ABC transporter permease [bacterium]
MVARRLGRNWWAMAGLIIIIILLGLAVFAPWIAPYGYEKIDYQAKLAGPSWAHWLGCDFLGRDLMSRMIYGARVSLAVAVVSTLISLGLGTAYGSISGYAGGRLDNAMMRVVDVIYSFPDLLLIILVNASINREWLDGLLARPGLGLIALFVNADNLALLIALSLVSWVYVARLIRGEVLRLREETYIEAARALGVGHTGIIVRHILPNTWGPLIVTLTFRIPAVILAESTLSFIGLGIQPPKSSWGTLAADGWTSMQFYPRLILAPSIAIFITMIAFNFLGDGLRDALAPERKV